MTASLQDVDLYLTVAGNLLGSSSSLYYTSSQTALDSILGFVADEQPVKHPLFSEKSKMIDYSQFKVRGIIRTRNILSLPNIFRR